MSEINKVNRADEQKEIEEEGRLASGMAELAVSEAMRPLESQELMIPDKPKHNYKLDLSNVPAKYHEAAKVLAGPILHAIWGQLSNYFNEDILPKINNNIEWVNHTTLGGDEILQSYQQAFAKDQAETMKDERSAQNKDVLGGGLVTMFE